MRLYTRFIFHESILATLVVIICAKEVETVSRNNLRGIKAYLGD